ncbi:MAG: hypothetical protein MZV63_33885 [Marinilabiliales bacterium]|nr:hypothetical protein [Marinilabiliales bacterium]
MRAGRGSNASRGRPGRSSARIAPSGECGVAHVDHHRHPHGLGGPSGRAASGSRPLLPDMATRQAGLDPLDHVPVPLHDADRPLRAGVAEVLQFVVQRAHHPDGGDVQERHHPRLGDVDDVPPQPVERVCTGRARIAHRRHPAGQAGGVRRDPVMAHAGIHVHVNINQPRRHEMPRRVQDLPGRVRRDLLRHGHDPTRLDRHIPSFGQALRGVHHHAISDHEIVHGPLALLRRALW